MKSIPNIMKWKFKKLHKPNFKFVKLVEQKAFYPMFATYAIQAAEAGKITFKQLEALRRTLRRGLGKASKLLFTVSISTPVSKKPVATRMGKGKGGISFWVAVVKAGKILVEIQCLSSISADVVLKKASSKLPLKTNILLLSF